jgi:hypothetical protein
MNFERKLRLVRGDEKPEFPKASLWLRGAARLTDSLLAYALFKAAGPAGALLALLYLLFGDGMFAGQSIGKKIFGVKAMFLPLRQGARHRDSFLRNAPFGFVVILSMLPDISRWAFWVGFGIVGALETLQVFRDPAGLRMGDTWAQTQVIDGKDPTQDADELPVLHGHKAVPQPAK